MSQPRSGLLSTVQTRVCTDNFNNCYTLVGKELGRGKFAVVKKCIEKATRKEYAAKFMRKRRKGQDCRMEIIHEIAVLELAESSHWVINLYEVYETASEMILVLEYAAGGEIFNQCVAEREEAFKEKDVKRLMRQILEGVAFLHRNNIVHLDLKPQNILLTSVSPLGNIKIVDFGLSRHVNDNEELREIMGTPEYVAPEILNYEPISTATDMCKQETFLNISQLNLSFTEDDFENISKKAIDFIKTLLVKDPEERALAEECLRHPWLAYECDETEFVSEASTNALESIASEESEAQSQETEELIVMASYTLGQCRQSEKENIKTDQKAISKRFKFEEPFNTLQEIPGEFIY
ncbi:serine/threonine-protein kinase 17A isoform X2 [Stegostoma tigrinum]|uniref:serine/threonine-protein kinase 17A isoform X2 n=1 Tax=Stegostoma tigrinum TaxID=3053191 RepID=UPI0028703FE7|nr:serine/threonine-protein kinase 17A isoform X2 [Stegostoma tigrinum]